MLDLSNLQRLNKCNFKIYAYLHGNKASQTTLPNNKFWKRNIILKLEIQSALSPEVDNL